MRECSERYWAIPRCPRDVRANRMSREDIVKYGDVIEMLGIIYASSGVINLVRPVVSRIKINAMLIVRN